MNEMEKVIVLIPSLEPKEDFVIFLSDMKNTFKNVIVVNDGSSNEYDKIFENISKIGVTILKNNINLGKGVALKHGINYILNTFENGSVIVTADSDGQHTIQDIKKCATAALENENKLILGVRNFDNDDVPYKSKFGNKLTRNVFKLFVGLNISDTQTGLRAFGFETAKKLLSVSGERFDYETNMLIATKDKDIDIMEVNISTIYINENKSTHFNPLKDSINIYKLFFRYIFSAISSFLVDILLFSFLYNMLFNGLDKKAVFISTAVARIVSSLYNYLLNSKIVFKKINTIGTFIKYYLLVVVQMSVSAILVYELNNIITFVNITIIKAIIDAIIFVVNFYVQREWVFKER